MSNTEDQAQADQYADYLAYLAECDTVNEGRAKEGTAMIERRRLEEAVIVHGMWSDDD